jgi:hypothetical protein
MKLGRTIKIGHIYIILPDFPLLHKPQYIHIVILLISYLSNSQSHILETVKTQ